MNPFSLLVCFFPLALFGNLCFIHISKTAGTTMHALLQQHFGQSAIYPYRGIGESGILVNQNAAPLEMPLSFQTVVSGHFPLWWLRDNNLASFCFTILRDPIERVISHYFFKVQYGYPSLGLPVHSPLDVVPNLMCRMLASDLTLDGDALLEDAIQNLAHLDFIIFFDDFEGGVKRLFRKLGIAHQGNIPRLNKTKRGEELDVSIIEEVRKKNALDIKLYRYALNCLRNKSY